MAEAAASVLTLVTFGIQTTSLVLQAIQDFRRAPKTINQLKAELLALQAVLRNLEGISNDTDQIFIELKVPLRHCAEACKEFGSILSQEAGTSSETRARFQDWFKLKYHGGDINDFKGTISAYKSTITIALCSLNLRSSNVTLEVFTEYKQMITDTTFDLQSRLQTIEGHLQLLVSSRAEQSDRNASDIRRQAEEEKNAIMKCMQICDDVSAHINTLNAETFPFSNRQPNANDPAGKAFSAWVAAGQTLAGCKSQLENHIDELRVRLLERSQLPDTEVEQVRKQAIVDEIHGLQRSIDICNNANVEADRHRTNVFENISMGDDTRQIIVSTVGDLVFAKGLTTGSRSVQLMGQMSDKTVQYATSSSVNVRNVERADDRAKTQPNRYGIGRDPRQQAKSGEKSNT